MITPIENDPKGSGPALEVEGLAKTFGKGKRAVRAVQGVHFEVALGQVYGFLGPNGAGKSTTIRMIMDLVRPSAGRVRVFGEDVRSRPAALRRVGAMVEGALFYEHLSGRRNLEVLARTHGKHTPDEVEVLLERLGMSDRADRRVNGYSMGMKQRLGVAAALLHRPRLVILDEPTNGLDPSGILEMRRFIRQLAEQDGMTVFLSSHLLAEVEQVCDRVAIISHGRLVREGNVAELLAGQERLCLDVSSRERAAEVLGEIWKVEEHSGALRLEATREATPAVVRRLVEAGVDVFEARRERRSLEDLFMEVTQGGRHV